MTRIAIGVTEYRQLLDDDLAAIGQHLGVLLVDQDSDGKLGLAAALPGHGVVDGSAEVFIRQPADALFARIALVLRVFLDGGPVTEPAAF